MEDVKRQRLDAVRRAEEIGDMAYRAFVWLEKNRDLFKEWVYGPLCVEVQTKDPIHAAYLEMSVAKWLCTVCYSFFFFSFCFFVLKLTSSH